MKKKQRQALIRQMITEQPIGTQEELLTRLHEAGARCDSSYDFSRHQRNEVSKKPR